MHNDSLGSRMKHNYEDVFRQQLPLRIPYIVRIDGRAFHTWTRGFTKPYDPVLMERMQTIAKEIMKEAQGCKLAYGQSDEISFLFNSFEEKETQTWFDGNVQKIVSVSASMASSLLSRMYPERLPPTFDARVFVLPEAEVNNYFVWRQKDAERNALSSVCQVVFPHKELQFKRAEQQIAMLAGNNVFYKNYPEEFRKGWCVLRTPQKVAGEESVTIDKEIPSFKNLPSYVERCLNYNF